MNSKNPNQNLRSKLSIVFDNHLNNPIMPADGVACKKNFAKFDDFQCIRRDTTLPLYTNNSLCKIYRKQSSMHQSINIPRSLPLAYKYNMLLPFREQCSKIDYLPYKMCTLKEDKLSRLFSWSSIIVQTTVTV